MLDSLSCVRFYMKSIWFGLQTEVRLLKVAPYCSFCFATLQHRFGSWLLMQCTPVTFMPRLCKSTPSLLRVALYWWSCVFCDEDDAQDAELRRFKTNFIFRILEFTAVFLFCYHHSQVQKRVHPGQRPGSSGGGAGRSSIRRW